MFESFDAAMLDDTLLYNKRIHKSPLTYLQEILMYDYDINDIIECGYNYKDIAVSECDDGISNTLSYYAEKLTNAGCTQRQIESVLHMLKEKRYSIFYIDNKSQRIYLVSLNPYSNLDICIDPSMKYFQSNSVMTGDISSAWSDMICELTFNEFKNKIYTEFSESYANTGEIWDLIQSNNEYMTRVGIQPSYATESIGFDNHYNDFVIGKSLSPATEAPKAKTPAQKVEDGLSELERMSDSDNEADTGTNAGNTIDNTREARDRDNEIIDAAQATSDKLEEDGQDSPDDVGEDGGEEPTEDNEESPDEGGDAEDDESMDEESPEDNALNDLETRKKYHLKLKKLYKYINDSIDALATFTPAYNFEFVSTYYDIQNNFARLRDAIFKICTEKINDMDVVDIMKKYANACMAYDSLLAMLREFVDKYRKERDNRDKKAPKQRS